VTLSAAGRRDARRAHLALAARAVLSRALAVVAALALVVGLARANARYFFCASMATVASASCCAHAPAGDAAEAPEGGAVDVTLADCCRAERMGALPAGSAGGGAPDVPAAAWLATVAPVAWNVMRADMRDPSPPAGAEAHLTGPPGAGAWRARTMVFLL
jgi:hypothetical protein